MTRAEERALEAYPDKEMNGVALLFHEQRRLFKEGYETAEKDLALTWEDMKEIQRLLDVVWSEQDITAPIDEDSSIYPEVLKRFKEGKQ